MVNVAVWVHPDGNVVTTGFAWHDATRPPTLSDAEFLNHAMRRIFTTVGISPDHPYRVIPQYLLAVQDEYFRDCWVDTDFTVDLSRARTLHMDNIRQARDKALIALDVPFMRAVESGDLAEQQRIREEKQRLRDIPSTFDLSIYATATEIKAAWPTGLDQGDDSP